MPGFDFLEVNNLQELIGTIVICIGIAFMIFGVYGIFKLKDFYPRLLVASKVDTVGMLTLCIGFIIRSGISFFSGKLILLVVIILILNPLVAHIMARSAHSSGVDVIDSEDGGEAENKTEESDSVENT